MTDVLTINLRISREVKAQLQSEAAERELSMNRYLNSLIGKRHFRQQVSFDIAEVHAKLDALLQRTEGGRAPPSLSAIGS